MGLSKSHLNSDPAKRISRSAVKGHAKKYHVADNVLLEVYLQLINGKQPTELQQALMEGAINGQEKPVKKSQAWYYIKAARERMRIDFDEELKNARSDLYAKYMAIYEEAFATGEYSAAKNALDSLSKMMGAFEPDKVNLNANGNITVSFGFAKNDDNDE